MRRLFGLLGRAIDGLAAFRYVLAHARDGVAAREERGSADQKQSDESCHVVAFWKTPVPAVVTESDTQGTAGSSEASAGSLHEFFCN